MYLWMYNVEKRWHLHFQKSSGRACKRTHLMSCFTLIQELNVFPPRIWCVCVLWEWGLAVQLCVFFLSEQKGDMEWKWEGIGGSHLHLYEQRTLSSPALNSLHTIFKTSTYARRITKYSSYFAMLILVEIRYTKPHPMTFKFGHDQ